MVADLHIAVNNIKPYSCHGNEKIGAICNVVDLLQYILHCCNYKRAQVIMFF